LNCGNVGENEVTLSGTDECGNVGTCIANVTVIDDLPPVLTCPLNTTISLDPGLCGQVYNFTIGVDDNCPSGLSHVTGPYCDPCLDPSGGSALACAPFAENSIIQFIPLSGGAGEILYVTYNQETFGDAPLATFNIY